MTMDKELLVGSTGFVGGNLMKNHNFTSCCHSVDVKKYYGSTPDLCVYGGIPSAMFLANQNPERDLEIMKEARINLKEINPKQVVLISTIAVYPDSKGKDENSLIREDSLTAYGKNRLLFEWWVREDFGTARIIRLPALYGTGLKKNFLFDLHHMIPALLKPDKYHELCMDNPYIRQAYKKQDTNFYRLREDSDKVRLKKFFEDHSFNALSFTDSRSKFQFYNLKNLWSHIEKALRDNIYLLNLCTPPVSAGEVYRRVTGKDDWDNHLMDAPFDYDLHSAYSEALGGKGFYLCDRETELTDIDRFMKDWNK